MGRLCVISISFFVQSKLFLVGFLTVELQSYNLFQINLFHRNSLKKAGNGVLQVKVNHRYF